MKLPRIRRMELCGPTCFVSAHPNPKAHKINYMLMSYYIFQFLLVSLHNKSLKVLLRVKHD
jgi:hypothetical protein